MKMPKPIITTTHQGKLTRYRYIVADRDDIWRDYRIRQSCVRSLRDFQPSSVTYGAAL